MKIKIFVSKWYGDLEEQVNKWLAENENKIEIKLDDIKFAFSENGFSVMIVYKEFEVTSFENFKMKFI